MRRRNHPTPWSLAALAALITALTLLAPPTLAALFPKNSPVVQLTSSSFKREILSIEKPALVAFTAPWCGHCQRLSPEYDRAARSLDGIVKFANIDCDAEENKPTCGRYDVKGFPTILLFPPTKNRVPRPYNGERTAKALVDYAVGTLPHNVKKLNAGDLATWAAKETTKAKVLLLSNKPTSSPLYKSLALDFRRSMAFAFARGDQAPVQAQARVALGVDVKGDKDLPTLVVLPPVSAESPLEKGKFETYQGKLKYPLLKAWLDGVKEKYGIEDVADPPKGAAKGKGKDKDKGKGKDKAKAKEKTKDKAKKASGKSKPSAAKKPTKSTKEAEPPLPEGAAYEWKLKDHDKAQKKKEAGKAQEAKADDAESPPMLSKDRAAQLAEEVKAQQEAVVSEEREKDKATDTHEEHTGHAAGTPRQQVFMEAGETVEGGGAAGHSEAEEAGDHKPYVYTDSQRIDLDAINSLLEEAGAYEVADEAVERVARAAGQVKASAGEAYERVRKAAEKLASGREGEGAFNTLDKSKSSSEGGSAEADTAPFERKRASLLSAFERWLAGEHPDWETDYAEDFLAATRDVEDLLRRDPAKAQDLAWESETWLLSQLEADRKKMTGGEGTQGPRLGEGKLKSLDEMIALIKTRLAQRGKDQEGRKEQQEGFDIDAALRAAMSGEAAREEGEKKGHDEL